MKHIEAKYRVDSFRPIIEKLAALGAQADKTTISKHYYAHVPGNDVVKLVIKAELCEIHKLAEDKGQFALVETIKVTDKPSGFAWLKARNFSTADVIKMEQTDYPYQEGLVGLYIINDFLHSVI